VSRLCMGIPRSVGGGKMQVGDLIRYKAFPENGYNGYGVVLDMDDDMVLFYFVDHHRDHPDYIWDFTDQLEAIKCK